MRRQYDFNETFAPVAKFNTIKSIAALARSKGWEVKHLDVKPTFLNDRIKEVYMTQPRGYEVPRTANLICKLERVLYGLKQAP